jgi:hypothetical protein
LVFKRRGTFTVSFHFTKSSTPFSLLRASFAGAA